MTKLLFTSIISILGFIGCSGKAPSNLGVTNGRLAPCPSSPNCVSTFASDPEHRMDPIPYSGSREEAVKKVVETINSMKRTKITARKNDYIRAEFRSALWRFVDDVEFYFDDEKKLVHFRSASRLGYSDLGVNRKRMKAISEKLGKI